MDAITRLKQITIPIPCDVPWNSMTGDGKARHCEQCQMTVYNISAMSKREAAKLLQKKKGRLCVQLFRRNDGTLVTSDCTEGRVALGSKHAVRTPVMQRRFQFSLLTLLLWVTGTAVGVGLAQNLPESWRNSLANWIYGDDSRNHPQASGGGRVVYTYTGYSRWVGEAQ